MKQHSIASKLTSTNCIVNCSNEIVAKYKNENLQTLTPVEINLIIPVQVLLSNFPLIFESETLKLTLFYSGCFPHRISRKNLEGKVKKFFLVWFVWLLTTINVPAVEIF